RTACRVNVGGAPVRTWIPRRGEDDWGNDVVLVRRLQREQPNGADCESCGDRIRPEQAAYRDQFRSTRGNWYTHASPRECITFVNFDAKEWTQIALSASR